MSFASKFGVLAIVLALTACGKDSKGGGGALIIPTDIAFDEKTLPAMSDQEVADAKMVVQSAGQAVGPEHQILIPTDEEPNDRAERERDFNKLRPELQQLVLDLRGLCPTSHQKTETPFEGQPQAGKSALSSESNQTTGAACPVDMRKATETRTVIASFSQNPPSFAMNMSASGSSSVTYNNAAHQQTVGASTYNMQFNMVGRVERSETTISLYFRVNAAGAMTVVKNGLGTISMTMTSENLEKTGNEKTLTSYRISHAGKTYVFTQYVEQKGHTMPVPRYFIGSRELTRAEVVAMGEFPFDVDGNNNGGLSRRLNISAIAPL